MGNLMGNDDPYVTRPSLFLKLKVADPAPRELAWTVFQSRYAPVIAGFARKLGVKPHDVDDVIQDVLTGFYAASPKFVYDPSKGRFRGFLKTCTYRAVRRRFATVTAINNRRLEDVDPQSMEVEQVFADIWAQQHLRRAMDELREQSKGSKVFAAFEQYVVLSKSPQDVAKDLAISVDSVYKAKERVVAALRRKLSILEEDEG
jgi:RNA polymerase sigma-70 factor (ECF subfamily)